MTGRQDLFDESMSLGHSAAWDLEWQKAIGYYRKALVEFPENTNALTSLALAQLETGNFTDSLDTYQRACSVAPDDPIPVEKSAEIHERTGNQAQAISMREIAADLHIRRRNTEKAIENWSIIARLTPDNLAVRSRLALMYERLGRKREASYEYLAIASIWQTKNQINRAMESAQLALRLSPNNRNATAAVHSLRQGKVLPAPGPPSGRTGPLRLAEMGDYLKSIPAKEEVSDESTADLDDPEEAAQRQALAILAGMLFDESSDDSDPNDQQTAAGSSSLSRLRKNTTRQDKFQALSRGIDLQTRGNKRQATKEFILAIERGLEHPALYYNLGSLQKELHDYDSARKNLLQAVGHPELTLGSNLALGRLSRQTGDMSEAARYLLEALRIADSLSVDDSQSAQLNRFYDTIKASQTEGDEETLAQIVENTLTFLTGPRWLQRIKLARQKLQKQGSGGAIVPIAEILAVGGTDQVVQALERIDNLVSRKLYHSAMEETMQALGHAPHYLGLHLRMAEIQLQSHHQESGLEKLSMIAETHRIRGETIQAVKLYTRILKISPVDLRIRTKLIDLLAQQDQIDEALKQYLELGNLYRQMADSESARDELTKGLKLAQRSTEEAMWSVRFLLEIGDIDISRLDWQRAMRVFDQILHLQPDHEDARLKMIDLGLRLGKETVVASHLDDYLQFLVKVNRGKDALSLLEDLARDNPGKQVLHARLAEAYRAIGSKSDAIAQYDALAEIQLDAGQTRNAIRTIQTMIELGPPEINVDGYRELLHNLETGQT